MFFLGNSAYLCTLPLTFKILKSKIYFLNNVDNVILHTGTTTHCEFHWEHSPSCYKVSRHTSMMMLLLVMICQRQTLKPLYVDDNSACQISAFWRNCCCKSAYLLLLSTLPSYRQDQDNLCMFTLLFGRNQNNVYLPRSVPVEKSKQNVLGSHEIISTHCFGSSIPWLPQLNT